RTVGDRADRAGAPAIALATAGVVALVAWNLTHQPPPVHPDGGVPAATIAGDRTVAALRTAGIAADAVVELRSLPDFKSTEAMAYPLIRAGQTVIARTPQGVSPGSADLLSVAADGPGALVLLCDDLFREAIGAACGGPAEATITPDDGGPDRGPLLDRFESHPGRWVSVYGPGG
ncbi:MAG TPA: hypothetical protein VD763_01985, partial [Candidatus Saccharimonadales bacterium]|nr:hypothetical protein [Candidatus Saccharimonadales bacterium]